MEKKRTEFEVLRLINPEHKPLTKEKLCELSGLNLNDEQAEETVNAIHLFAKLLYELMRKTHHIALIINKLYIWMGARKRLPDIIVVIHLPL